MAKFDPFAGAGKDIFTEESGPGVPKRTRRTMRLLDQLLGLGYGEAGAEGLNQGSVVTQTSPLEATSLTGLEEAAKGIVSGEGATSQQFGLGRGTTADVLSQAGPTFENYFQESIQNPLLQMFQEKVVPQLNVELARSGFFGTGRERALGSSTDNLMRALVENKAALSKELLDTRLKGAGLATTQAGFERESDINSLMQTLQAGDTQRQKELDRIKLLFGLGGFTNQSNAPLQQSDLFAQQSNEQTDQMFMDIMGQLLLGSVRGGGQNV